ncbi:MAG: alpha-glucuronidase, partial [Bacteroidaceae bacterium]|nr:alpha-glucuronidase [Bacteroidaceae bacterium]
MKKTLLFAAALLSCLSAFADDAPLQLRLLNHWDNLDGTVERGYAGKSIFWNCNRQYDYNKYAQELKSEGINGTVLNNVNASPKVLTPEYIDSVKYFADIFRKEGIKVYLSINFASPMVIGGLSTADPLDKNVRKWWVKKAKEIYKQIPDFGGFLVKANSEGQPGPMDYGRTHVDGANMLADAVKPFGGIIMWRAFVYSQNDPDRAKQAYIEFQPYDGKFRDNVIIQIKNGPIDFQPREPVSPLFFALPKTKVMAEFQITQEYLGHANHIIYLGTMWEETLRTINKYRDRMNYVGAAGVSNRGNYPKGNHFFAKLNEYAFAHMAANPHAKAKDVAREWLEKKFGGNKRLTDRLLQMLMISREAEVDFMMPLGLHHIFAWGHHYGPEPWCAVDGARPDWLPSYYHRADAEGLGFNRSSTGSNATAQYPEDMAKKLDDRQKCPDKYVLWFHHVKWGDLLQSRRTLWDELCYRYQHGIDEVREMQHIWYNAEHDIRGYEADGSIPGNTYDDVKQRLAIQEHDAIWWKDACLQYFQTFSKLPIPAYC